jgi:hypothetical protein
MMDVMTGLKVQVPPDCANRGREPVKDRREKNNMDSSAARQRRDESMQGARIEMSSRIPRHGRRQRQDCQRVASLRRSQVRGANKTLVRFIAPSHLLTRLLLHAASRGWGSPPPVSRCGRALLSVFRAGRTHLSDATTLDGSQGEEREREKKKKGCRALCDATTPHRAMQRTPAKESRSAPQDKTALGARAE